MTEEILEPGISDDGSEEGFGFFHPVLVVALDEDLVVLGEGDEEHDGGDVLEAVDPLPTLGALSSDIHHTEDDLVEVEGVLDDASRGNTNTEDVLLCGEVIGLGEAVEVAQVVFGGVCELVLATSVVGLLDSRVSPEVFDEGDVWLLEARHSLVVDGPNHLCLLRVLWVLEGNPRL